MPRARRTPSAAAAGIEALRDHHLVVDDDGGGAVAVGVPPILVLKQILERHRVGAVAERRAELRNFSGAFQLLAELGLQTSDVVFEGACDVGGLLPRGCVGGRALADEHAGAGQGRHAANQQHDPPTRARPVHGFASLLLAIPGRPRVAILSSAAAPPRPAARTSRSRPRA